MLPCPVTLAVDSLATMLNCELADHPVYDGIELQWFEDERHGTGMLAFLSRRADRRVDYYPAPGLRLDRDGYHIGGGTGAWTETSFEVARLRVTDDGVDAEVRFTDVDGRSIEVRVDDRDGRPRRRAGLLAPVSSAIEHPTSLMIVWMPAFDLVHVAGRMPVIRIDGEYAAIGRLPGARLHRRHLIKCAAPVVTVHLARDHDGPLADRPLAQREDRDATGVVGVTAEGGGTTAVLTFAPGLPDVLDLPDGTSHQGAWTVAVGGTRITGGRWHAERHGDRADFGLDVTERWRPGRLPPIMRVVTTVVPMFRRWPTTYRWRATVTLGEEPTVASSWERIGADGADAYRRATGS